MMFSGNSMTISLDFLLLLLLWCTGYGSCEVIRWVVPSVNGRICREATCVITRPFTLTSSRIQYMDLSPYMFLGNVTIVNDHITQIRSPKKPVQLPDQKVIIRTRIPHDNAQILRKIFRQNELTITGRRECYVDGSLPLNCHHVIGDLRINKTFKPPPPTDKTQYVLTVSGCIFIEDTDFTNWDLNFLNGLVLDNNICGDVTTMLYQRIVNNRRLCKTDLFPSLASFEKERHCGTTFLHVPPAFAAIQFHIIAVFVWLAMTVPLMMFMNSKLDANFRTKEVEKAMDTLDRHVLAVLAWRKRRGRQQSTVDSSTTNMLQSRSNVQSEAEPQAPVRDTTDAEKDFHVSLVIREWVQKTFVYAAGGIIVVFFVNVFIYKLAY